MQKKSNTKLSLLAVPIQSKGRYCLQLSDAQHSLLSTCQQRKPPAWGCPGDQQAYRKRFYG